MLEIKELLNRLSTSEWSFEGQQRDAHPPLMADFWCRSAAFNFSEELNVNFGSIDYFYTDLNKGYVNTVQHERLLNYIKKLDLEGLRHLLHLTRQRVAEFERLARHISCLDLDALLLAELADLWETYDSLFCKIIPWFFFPYYVTEQNIVTDLLELQLKRYAAQIGKITDTQNALMVLIFPDKIVEFQREQGSFLSLVAKEKASPGYLGSKSGRKAAMKYLDHFAWMKTFLLLPREPLSLTDLEVCVRDAIQGDAFEQHELQERSKRKQIELGKKLLKIVKSDCDVMELVKLAKEYGFELTSSVERLLRAHARLIPFLKRLARTLGIDFFDLALLTSDEIFGLLHGKISIADLKIEERKKGYIYLMEWGKASVWYGEAAHETALLIDSALSLPTGEVASVAGRSAFPGVVRGRACVAPGAKDSYKVREGDILVCAMTSPDYLPAVRRAAAFVTDEGGLLCHAAIIARELSKPCVIGTKIATKVLRDGDEVEVDADNGIVRILKRV
ncbi:MAG: PEP-utilizing enzyme [Patescibacteria group bacterium]